jgi:exopolysaccharide production protein ExoQ
MSAIAIVRAALGSRRVSQGLAELIIITALVLPSLRAVIPGPTLAAILVTLVGTTVAVFIVQYEEAKWFGALPLSLGGFFAAVLVSITWTATPGATAQGIAEALSFVLMGLYLALLRDAVQVVRAVGNASRVVITASAGLEVLNGAVLAEPIGVFSNAGSLIDGGPATGIVGSPEALGFVCLLALIAWWIEWHGHMAPRENLAAWIALSLGLLALTRLPMAAVSLVILVAVLVITAWLRQCEPRARLVGQSLVAIAVLATTAIALSTPTSWFAGDAGSRRGNLWDAIRELSEMRLTLGWGWVGPWPTEGTDFPYSYLAIISPTGGARSAESSYLDVQLQLGVVGLTLLLIALGLAFVRGWLVASARRSAVHHWPVLTITLLAWWSLTSSIITSGLGVLLTVAAGMSAARNRSWRKLISAPRKARKVR